jgi:phenylpropionate dioxygenase-like ring-hydroxylating dioxygenase large terminal subunit
MWVKNSWYVAALSGEVQGKLLARTILGTPVVMYRRSDDAVVALEDRCAHRRLPLSFGFLENDNVVCGYHGMTFDDTGKCIRVPGQEKIPAGAGVRSFPVMERHNVVWIWVGKRELADSSSVPDLDRLAHPDWIASKGYTLLHSDYRLLNDNLLDLSHVAFVHGKTIGNAAVAEAPIAVTQNGNVVSVHRDIVGAMAPPFYTHLGKFRRPIHRWHTVNYHPPSICVIDVGCRPLEDGDGIGTIVGCVMHLATPETEKSTHYFWAFVRNFRQDDASLTTYIAQAVGATHDEDKVVVELQHSVPAPAQRDNPVALAIAVDGGPIRGRRVLERLIAAETDDAGVAA